MKNANLMNVLKTVQKLRNPKSGCPWDLDQTLYSLTNFMLEEAQEYINAVADGNPENICEELGDVLLQVLLNATIAEQCDLFSLEDVAKNLDKKLIQRHPHIFNKAFQKKKGKISSHQVIEQWELLKKSSSNYMQSFSEQFPKSMPALSASYKIGEKSFRQKFDWNNSIEVLKKVKEELLEVETELNKNKKQKSLVEEEIGDLLFSIVQLARHEKISPEIALIKANTKFIDRFEQMLKISKEENRLFAEIPASEKEKLWELSKTKIRKKTHYILKKKYIKLTSIERLYNINVPLIGITGGIACGKSFFREIIEELNFPTICADSIVKEIYRMPETLKFVKKSFPQLKTSQENFFKDLRKHVFNKPKDLKILENFIYPKIPPLFIQKMNSNYLTNFAFYDVPLLFEKGLEDKFDLIICISTSKKNQLERLLKRDTIDKDLALTMIDTQMELKLKEKKSDVVLKNNSSIKDFKLIVNKFIEIYFNKKLD